MSSSRFSFSLLALVALAGCSNGHKTTVMTSNGAATVSTSTDNKTTTVQTKEGTFTSGKGAVDIAKMNVAMYPGATQDEGGFAMNGVKGSGEMVSLTTGDSFDKVYDWYKSKMPASSEKMKVSSGDTTMAQFTTGEAGKEQTSITITARNGKTQILVSHSVPQKTP